MTDKLIIFDCDGVLVDSEPLAVEAYERVYEKHGMPGVGVNIISQCFGMKQADIVARIRDLTGHQLPDHAQDDLWPETKALFTERLVETPGLKRLLDSVPAARCVASSSSLERIHHSLSITGVAPYFGDAVFSSSMVKRGKPFPDIFLHAAEKMVTEPSNCVVIEDSPLGVQGAVAANMVAIGYIGGGHSYDGHADMLSSNGAAAVYDNWDAVRRDLAGRGFLS